LYYSLFSWYSEVGMFGVWAKVYGAGNPLGWLASRQRYMELGTLWEVYGVGEPIGRNWVSLCLSGFVSAPLRGVLARGRLDWPG